MTSLRLFGTFISVAVYGWFNFFLNIAGPAVTNPAAAKQFDDSDAAYIVSQYGIRLVSFAGGISTLILLAVLWLIWHGVVARATKDERVRQKIRDTFAPAIALFFLAVFVPHDAFAYYDKTDYAEPYFILPNESAFFIPDVGSSTSQAAFGSEQYLAQNKIAAKRFIIPHGKLANSGLFSDFYVPTGRLIIVDRTPYNREWTAKGRGTQGAVDESFPCQSSEGLNITVEVGIATSVLEAQAATFLYHFGVNKPAGNRADPQVIFTSVFQGRSLAQVMDTVVRGKVQTLVCHEFAGRTLDQSNKDGVTIIDNVQKSVTAYLGSVGITLDYVGWAGTFTFDKDVQTAINDKYRALTVASSIPILQSAADIKVKEGLGEGLRTRGLPSFIGSMSDLLSTLTGAKK